MWKKALLPALIVLIVTSLAGCAGVGGNGEPGPLMASGRVSANEIRISTEVGGKVTEVGFREGDSVAVGDVLFRVDDQLLRAQQDQAEEAARAAEASLEAARAQVDNARVQERLAVQGARLQDQQSRTESWMATQPAEFNLPTWYFGRGELIEAAQAEVQAATDNLAAQAANLEQALQKGSNVRFVQAEDRLARAQAAFSVAVPTLLQAQATANETLQEMAADAHDSALKELEAAQLEYRRILTTTVADEVMEARARVAVGQTRLDTARDRLSALQSGEYSVSVEAARSGVTLAETAIPQAEANLAQAQAALALIQVQLDKTATESPVSGVILSQAVKVGEMAAPGGTMLTIGQLDEVELTVYVPEDDYGRISVGDAVSIEVDAFPGKTFAGTVRYIADQAEFTPRNVQTVDGRKTTVYAVKITAPNPDRDLKPGMPADVTFAD